MQEIIPFTKLGDFSFNDSLNKVLSLIKQKGEMYQQCDIVIGDNFIDPLYFYIKVNKIFELAVLYFIFCADILWNFWFYIKFKINLPFFLLFNACF